MEDVTFRLARPSDFDDVLKLSDGVYSGNDYLPLQFHNWLKTENAIVMLAHVGEKLVCLSACFIVDEGKTCLGRAGRILEEFKGQGIWQQLLGARKEYVQRRFPSVCRERFTTTFAGFSADAWSHITQLMEFAMLSCEVKQQTRYRFLQLPSSGSVEVEVCTRDYFADVILSPPVARKLFPNNIVTVAEWSPFEPVQSNIQYMLEEDDYILVDKCSEQTFPRSFSFGRLSPRAANVLWMVCVYTDDPVLFEAHLITQLKRACHVIPGNFSFIVGFEKKTLKACGEKLFEERLLAQKSDFVLNETMKLYERKFIDQSHL